MCRVVHQAACTVRIASSCCADALAWLRHDHCITLVHLLTSPESDAPEELEGRQWVCMANPSASTYGAAPHLQGV